MTAQTNPSTKQSANTAPNTSYEHEQTSDSETDLLIPYVSDGEEEEEEEEEEVSDNEPGPFGHCWHCDAPLPLPTSDETNVNCLECQFPN